MNKDLICFATVTLARSRSEEKIILESLKALSETGLSMVVVDGGSSKDFIADLKSIPRINIKRETKGNLFTQVRQALKEASVRYPFIFYSESNKFEFLFKKSKDFLRDARVLIQSDQNLGMILASRSKKSIATFPKFQRLEESIINELLCYLLKKKSTVDFTYGPRIINVSLIRYLEDISLNLGWGWMSFLLFAAKAENKKIYSTTLEALCPKNERMETKSDTKFRLRQFQNHLSAIDHGVSIFQ